MQRKRKGEKCTRRIEQSNVQKAKRTRRKKKVMEKWALEGTVAFQVLLQSASLSAYQELCRSRLNSPWFPTPSTSPLLLSRHVARLSNWFSLGSAICCTVPILGSKSCSNCLRTTSGIECWSFPNQTVRATGLRRCRPFPPTFHPKFSPPLQWTLAANSRHWTTIWRFQEWKTWWRRCRATRNIRDPGNNRNNTRNNTKKNKKKKKDCQWVL